MSPVERLHAATLEFHAATVAMGLTATATAGPGLPATITLHTESGVAFARANGAAIGAPYGGEEDGHWQRSLLFTADGIPFCAIERCTEQGDPL